MITARPAIRVSSYVAKPDATGEFAEVITEINVEGDKIEDMPLVTPASEMVLELVEVVEIFF